MALPRVKPFTVDYPHVTSAPREDQAELAWAHALESAARGAYRYLGLPEDSGNSNLKSHAEVSWEAAAALAAGVQALAASAQQNGLTWRQIAALAQSELDYLATAEPRRAAQSAKRPVGTARATKRAPATK